MARIEPALEAAPPSPWPKGTRRILHCDLDCFYAAVHMRDDPSLRGRPVVIGGSPTGRGVVAAASYEARRFGVHSAMPAAQAVRLCPDAVFLRPEFDRYRTESQRVFAIFRDYTERVQPVSIDEAYLDVTEELAPLGSATAIAQDIRRRVAEEIDLTVSIGVAPNRLVAKIASDHDKPDGLTVVRPNRVEAFLSPMPVRALMGVGPATARRLEEALEVTTVAQLRRVERASLEQTLGRFGGVLHGYARGIDDRPVVTERIRKSLSSEHTYSTDLTSPEEIRSEVERLTRSVARSLQERDLEGLSVVLKVRYDDFQTVTRTLTLDRPSHDEQLLLRCAAELLSRTEAGLRPVRLLGVGMARFEREDHDRRQLPLPFSSESPPPEDLRGSNGRRTTVGDQFSEDSA